MIDRRKASDAGNEITLDLTLGLEAAETRLRRAYGCLFAAYRDQVQPNPIDIRDAEEAARKITIALARYHNDVIRLGGQTALRLAGGDR